MAGLKSFDLLSTFAMDKLILIGTGIYSTTTERPIILYVKRTLRTLIFLLQIIQISCMGTFVVQNFNDTIKITETLFICMTVFFGLIKTINFLANIKLFVLIEKYLSNDKIKETTTKNTTMLRQDIGQTQKIMAIYKLGIIQTVIIYFAKPLVVINEEQRLPMASYYPWNVETPTNFFLTYVLQIVQITTSGLLSISIDVCFAIFCRIVSAELRVLKNNLTNIDYSASNGNAKFELRENIMLHKEILKMVNAIRTLFNYSILGQFLCSVIVICFSGFQLISSSDINQAIYLSNWYVADISTRKELIIFRECVKRPIILVVGKIVPLTVETLVKIYRSSYSFLAVLLQMI